MIQSTLYLLPINFIVSSINLNSKATPSDKIIEGTIKLEIVKKNKRAIMLFLVQRNDCKKFRIAEEIDPIYKKNIMNAMKAGVEILCYGCSFVKSNIELDKKIKFIDK